MKLQLTITKFRLVIIKDDFNNPIILISDSEIFPISLKKEGYSWFLELNFEYPHSGIAKIEIDDFKRLVQQRNGLTTLEVIGIRKEGYFTKCEAYKKLYCDSLGEAKDYCFGSMMGLMLCAVPVAYCCNHITVCGISIVGIGFFLCQNRQREDGCIGDCFGRISDKVKRLYNNVLEEYEKNKKSIKENELPNKIIAFKKSSNV